MADLERAIVRCWASLWSDRAVSYRRAGGLATDDATIAVVVQQLIRSDVSFVVFTTDPINGDDGHLVISATWGLGEAVVSGLVVPDHIVIGPDGGVLEYVVGGKHLMVIPGDAPGDGVREVPVPRAMRGMRTLTDAQAMRVGAAARGVAGRLGYQADLEGAFAGDALYLLQARPITTLGARPGG
jgi:pyruvate,water dikinase